MKKINVMLKDRSYEIYVENGSLRSLDKEILKKISSKRIAILSVANVFNKYGKQLFDNIQKTGIQCHRILIPNGENQKNINSLHFILKSMAQLGLQRDSCLVALGGGVVGDIGGLAASLYMRGINFIQCPTTLLAQVDASIGGKTAIDFAGTKNLVGTFYQPKLVIVDPTVLTTLSDRQFRTGLAEIIKYGVIKDELMFEKIEDKLDLILKRNKELLAFLIARSCKIKAQIVSVDEREKGKRAWLNYGHTLGHALESYFRFQKLTHGEAVAHGMRFAADLSYRLGLCAESVAQRQKMLLARAGLLRKLPKFDSKKVLEKMFLDKKSRGGQIQFVLTRKIGLVTIQKNISPAIILSALTQLQNNNSRLY